MLDVGLYGCKTWSRSLSMERTERITEGEVLNITYIKEKRIVVEEVHHMQSYRVWTLQFNTVKVITVINP